MKEVKIIIQQSGDTANFINFGSKCMIGTAPIFKIHRRGRVQTGFEINGRVHTDVYKAVKAISA